MIVGLVVWLTNARVSGRWFNPASLWRRHNTVNELKKLLDVNDHDVGAHNDLGRILVDKGRHAEALPHMEKAIARMDEAAETNYFLGLARLHTGDTERGLAAVERALEISPGFLYGEPRLALARWYTEALAAQARALELAPRLAVPLLCQAAGADALVAPRAARRVFAAAPDHVGPHALSIMKNGAIAAEWLTFRYEPFP